MRAQVHTHSFTIHTFEVDETWRAPVRVLCSLFQEAADEHARILGVSQESFLSRGIAWALGALSLRVTRRPKVRERITVATWPCGVTRMYALRHFRILDQQGGELVRGSSGWLVLDLASRGLAAMPRELEAIEPPDEPVPLDDFPPKPPRLRQWDRELAVPVRREDLDPNQHVNNARLLQWALEAAPGEYAALEPAEVDVLFRLECRHPDIVLSRCAAQESEQGQALVHSLVRQSDGKETTRARTVWRP